LDFGTDFYALQTWGEKNNRTGFAWLYNWATQKNVDSVYCGEMSLPRSFHLNMEKNLCMMPILPPESLIISKNTLDENIFWSCINGSKCCIINFNPTNNFILTLIGESNQKITLEHNGKNIILSETDVDDGRYNAPISVVNDIVLCFDSGIIEVFVNKGSLCGTRRYYSCSKLTKVEISGSHAELIHYCSTYDDIPKSDF
jgi:beta-fructofuranosidase